MPVALDPTTIEARARDLHRRALELMQRGRPAGGARLLRAGLRSLGWPLQSHNGAGAPGDPQRSALMARLLITLAMAEVELSRADAGFALLDIAEPLVAPGERGVLVQQRGLMLVQTGRMDEALHCLDEAVELLSRSGERLVLARTLLNRAVRHQNAGRVGLARLDLIRCERIARSLDQPLLLAKAANNHGYCDMLSGDIPSALRNFDTAAQGFAAASAHPLLGGVSVYKARALLAVGLFTEAAMELDAAMARPGHRWPSQDHADAELTRAHTALMARDWSAARNWARRSARRFRRQANNAWAAIADLVRLQADFQQRRALATTAARADQMTAELRTLGLDNDADTATLLAARAYVALGRRSEAIASLHRCRPQTLVGNRVQRRLAQAELCAADSDRHGVLRHCRLGLAMLSRNQSRFGSLDLRTGSAAIGSELAGLGLEVALASRSPALVFTWLERSRAQSFRARPVRPPADQQTAEAVAELRHLAKVMRAAELTGDKTLTIRRRCVELERAIRARGWQVDGDGERRACAGFGEMVAELAAAGNALISFVVHRGETIALVLTDRGGRLHRLGDWAGVAETITRLHRDLDALCDLVLPAALDTVIRTSARRQAGLLAERLLAPLWPLIGDRDIVLVPTRTLSAVPWSVLPGVRGRPVTVAPSASTWLDSRRSLQRSATGNGTSSSITGPLLVAGPALEHAASEVRAIAEIYPAATVLVGAGATVEATLRQMDGRLIVHVAAHGHHEQGNVLFSRLDLVDGPLMAYDIQQLAAAPAHVVLPACDIGRTVVRTGDELLGFTAALLYMGTRSVVSCVNRVLDDWAAGIMSAYHRALAAGRSSARALADACANEPFSPFVCFGSG
jgi:tetratricopeptide (TPR) repeat protein